MPVFTRPIPPPRPVPSRQSVPNDQSPHEAVIRAVDQRLDALPATPRKITRALRGLGFRGRRDNADDCVLCRYLIAHLPPGYLMRVDEQRVRLWWLDVWSDPLYERVLAPPVTEFVIGFDAGRYPALEE
ncbi:hypothetical protein [Actinomadura violacea]|uniref:Uncharacterized protein n=1 Tax=Actinomadura violacea TaxID=2819934 RepID=A0ABS3S7M2_9ACTN|nr:hypothetical protein [Actinomadura violacea]MBO2465004.1 hypothetical protein [Actinomadura violacea]